MIGSISKTKTEESAPSKPITKIKAKTESDDSEPIPMPKPVLKQPIWPELEALMKKYPEPFNEESLPPMVGDPIKIELTKTANFKPMRTTIARKYPIHYEQQAKEELAKLVKLGVIEKVPDNEATEWCSPGFFVPKPNGKGIRLVTDFSHLGKFVNRPVQPFEPTLDIIRGLSSEANYFARFDARSGYWQLALDPASKNYTVFLTPQGRYRYKRMPMGLSISGDLFNSRSDRVIEGLDKTVKLVDDILVTGTTKKELIERIDKLLQRAQKFGLLLSKDKVEIGDQITFAGHILSKGGTKPDPSKLASLRDFKSPTNITELRSFLGLANQLGIFIPDMAHLTEPIRPLLRKSNAFIWTSEHEKAFNKAKRVLCGDHVVRPFKTGLPIFVYTDASRLHGFGALLIQKEEDGKPRLIEAHSQSITDTQSRYSATELEMAGLYIAIKAFHHYLAGAPDFTAVVDHSALVGIFQKDLMSIENTRLLRFREKLLAYPGMKVLWQAGVRHQMADALSRRPHFGPKEDDGVAHSVNFIGFGDENDDLDDDFEDFTGLDPDSPALKDLIALCEGDEDYQRQIQAIKSKKAIQSFKNHPILNLKSIFNELTIYKDKLIL